MKHELHAERHVDAVRIRAQLTCMGLPEATRAHGGWLGIVGNAQGW